MRVLIVYRRAETGGIEQASKTLANAFINNNHEVHVMTLRGEQRPSGFNQNVIIHSVDLERKQRKSVFGFVWYILSKLVLRFTIPESGFYWKGISSSKIFDTEINRLQNEYGEFDLILIRGQGAFELVWRCKNDRVWFVVESAVTGFKGRAQKFLKLKLFAGRKVVFVSNGAKIELIEELGGEEVLKASPVIYNAVDFDRIKKDSMDDIEFIDKPYIVHVARLAAVKQQLKLIDAYKKAVGLGVVENLIIIGEGPERTAIETKIKQSNLESRVMLLGYKANPFPWVKNAKLFVLSSRSEGLGLVLIEALSLGVNCVAIDAPGGIREVLTGEQEKLLAKDDVDDLADKIVYALNNKVDIDIEDLGKFEQDKVVEQFLQLVDK